MTQLRFLNGLNTIGGNIVEFSEGDSRILMDFGTATDLTDETIASALEKGKLPHVPELFGLQSDAQFAHQAIFISHLHIDHIGALKYLKATLPIYLSEKSYRLYQTLIALGIETPVENILPIAFETPVTVGQFTVTGYPSDHDEPGIMALEVNDGKRRFVHSGDVRLNGPHRDRVLAWADQVKKPAVLLIEGTSFSFDTDGDVADATRPVQMNEHELQNTFIRHLGTATDGLVVINPYNRNYARMASLQVSAHLANRTIVWEPAEAKILDLMTAQTPDLILGDTITLDEVRLHPERYVLQNSFKNLNTLSDLNVAIYLHSNGEPLGDYDPRFQQLKDFLAEHDIPFELLSASGHAQREDLIELVKRVAPKIVVPWHSFHPEREAAALDEQTDAEVLLPEKDLYYDLDVE